MLTTYLSLTQQLLHDTSGSIYPPANLTAYINTARNDIALEGEIIRPLSSYSIPPGTSQVAYSLFTTTNYTGIQNVAVIRQLFYVPTENGTPQKLAFRPWEWYSSYNYTNPMFGVPTLWSALGSSLNSTIYIWPTAIASGASLFADSVWIPIPLINDSTLEAIPYPWTNCVPYYAAYLAYLYAQREEDAEKMWQLYQVFMKRARELVTSTVLGDQYPGANMGTKIANSSISLSTPMGKGS